MLIQSDTALFWFRRDLRLEDNAGIFHALRENEKVQPLFIFDNNILDKLPATDARVEFIYREIARLKEELETRGSSLLVFVGHPAKFFNQVQPKAVYANRDYEPYARRRDMEVEVLLRKKGIPFKTFKDQVIFETEDVIKDDGKPYSVYTPYSRKWKALFEGVKDLQYRTFPLLHRLQKTPPLPLPSLQDIGFRPTHTIFPERRVAHQLLRNYGARRDYPAAAGTSRLGVHLRFGTISVRGLAREAFDYAPVFLNELIWREFFSMILWHFPKVTDAAFKSSYDNIEWRNNEHEFERWCRGDTGYPLVDAGMRELNETGYMHNRVRMVVASFLTKHLLIDWRWGEAYFAGQLLDFDLASNNGGWQWAAGSGCDAAPWFRIFNPKLQQEKFDPDGLYVDRWIPGWRPGTYATPIVEHGQARLRAIAAYQRALGHQRL